MKQPTSMILLALLTFAMVGAARGQQQTFYDASGRRIHHSTADSQGTVTHYDAKGTVIDRKSANGGTTTVDFHDARGRKIGSFTATKR
jgi:YD repeat-containing protein